MILTREVLRRFGQETGLSQGSPELLIWTARVRRELGEVDRIGPLLDDAQALAKILGSIRGEAEVLLEMGEVAWFLGRKQEARAHWQVAMELGLPSLERTELYTRVQERLELV